MSEAMIVDISLANVQEMLVQNSNTHPVALVFWSAQNEQSRLIVTIFEKLAEEFAGKLIVGKVNTDIEKEICEKLGNPQAPFVKMIKMGDIADEKALLQSEETYRTWVEGFLENDPSEELRMQAKAAFHNGAFDEAVELLGEAAKINVNNFRIHLDLVQMYLQTGHLDKGQDLFEKLPDEAKKSPQGKELSGLMHFSEILAGAPDIEQIQQKLAEDQNDIQALMHLAGYLMLHGHAEKSLQALLKAFMVDREFNEGAARKALLQAFDMLGAKAPELVTQYRRKFQSLMY
ncbi:tetratricopeptide repeat protein [Thiomicrorhabdus sediminis]|uniref:Tetratricopeptide repeat protein n=1 Tax=Thiomicrorhabdus sediminis TaxID=2580412 RepID=A0A4P9K476_9GAMM|nr:tetratricopeptide repeat protein [Thiomicrorhabdus sediminis]QCU89722.1 tetratricopeptide repeat protein [Thiomicrorhabdus sediminis]